MPASEAVHSFSTTLTRAGNTIAEITSITGPGMSAGTVEVSHLNSPARFKEYIQGMLDGGEVSLSLNFIPGDTDGQMGLLADFKAGTLQDFVITWPVDLDATASFAGIVTAFEPETPEDAEIGLSVTIKVSGEVDIDVTASTGLTTPFFAISESAVVTPTKAGNVYTYVATVLTGVTSVTVTPTATAGEIKVNGNVVATGQPSSAIALGAAGSVTTITIEVKETGKTKKTYTIYLSRAA